MSPIAESPTVLGEIVSLTTLRPSPLNPRKRFDDASMRELTDNIMKHGVIVPMLVRRQNGVGEVIDGERRYRAAQRAGLERVPVVFRDELTDGEVIEIQLLSAIQRQDLTPLEEAAGFRSLIDSNPSHYSPAYIADRVGRTEKWVWDRMKLLDLVPLAKQLLEAELILVGHAEVLAKLKPEDQERAIGGREPFDGYITSGLFERAASRLGFDADVDDDDEDDEQVTDRDPVAPYRLYKARTVKELESWISTHVRFDVQHAATVAPLDFGDAALKVEEATAAPGRGKKVVEITNECQVPPDTRGEVKMLTARSWKRADGTLDSETCDHSVLGVVAAGRGYGRTFEVCIAKDKCEIHWKDEIKAKKKNDDLRAKGHGGRAAQNEVVNNAKQREKEERERKEADARRAQWGKLEPLIEAEAVAQAKKFKTLTPKQADLLNNLDLWRIHEQLKKVLGTAWFKQTTAVVFGCLMVSSTNCADFDDFVSSVAKPAGLDIKRLESVRDKALGVAAKPTAPKAARNAAPKKGKKR